MPYVTERTLPARTQAWLRAIAPHNTHALRLEKKHAALLVIDMQNYFLDPGSPTFTEGGAAVLSNVELLIAGFRKAHRPVIYTAHEHKSGKLDGGILGWWWQGMCMEGTPEAEIHPRLAPRADEKVVRKHRYSAFYNTDLETVLRCLGVRDLVVTGIMTNCCCETTARDAYMRDHRVFFLADATGSCDEALHLATLRTLAYGFACVTTTAEILRGLKARGR
jgi:ureidoacrylate peracid hydrolase